MCALVLLDLSSAFDTINHEKLLSRLSTRYGVSGIALKLIKSYLSNRTQKGLIDGVYSDPTPVTTGVPQESVFVPLLFILYIAPVGDIMRKHGLSYHFYADDTQFYVFFNVNDFANACTLLENCIVDVKMWTTLNHLKLNDERTEVILIGRSHFRSKLSNINLQVGDKCVSSVSSVRNLGVMFDQSLSTEQSVIKKCQIAMYNLFQI